MPQAARRYHEPGVGSRTGLRISNAPDDIQDFLAASKAQMDAHNRRGYDDDDDDDEEDEVDDEEEEDDGYPSRPRASIATRGRRSSGAASRGGQGGTRRSAARVNEAPGRGNKNSSSMDLASTSGPSPRSTLRKSLSSKRSRDSYSATSDADDSGTVERSFKLAGNMSYGSADVEELLEADQLAMQQAEDDDEEDDGAHRKGRPSAPGSTRKRARAPAAGFAARKAAKSSPAAGGVASLFAPLARSPAKAGAAKKGGGQGVKAANGTISRGKGANTRYVESQDEEDVEDPGYSRRGRGRKDASFEAVAYGDQDHEYDGYAGDDVAADEYPENYEEDRDDRLLAEEVEELTDPEILERTTAGKREKQGARKAAAARSKVSAGQKGKPMSAKGKERQPATKEKSIKGRRAAASSEDEVDGSEVEDDVPELHVVKRSVKTPSARRTRGPSEEAYAQRQVVERVTSQAQRIPADEDAEGIRRSKRHRYQPLEWWRGERAVYGRPSLPKSGGGASARQSQASSPRRRVVPVPVLKEIVRVPKRQGEGTFSGMSVLPKNRGRVKRSTSARGESSEPQAGTSGAKKRKLAGEADLSADAFIELDPTADSVNVEDGWDKDTEPYGLVWDADTVKEVQRHIACTSSQIRVRKAHNATFAFEKVFGVDEFMAAGVLHIEVDGQKPVKPSKDNNYVFVVLQGAARVTVNRSTFLVAPGGMFFVPKGNNYGIENVSKRELRLFFSQARNVHPANLALRASVQPVALTLPFRGMPNGATEYSGTSMIGGAAFGGVGSAIGGRMAGEASFSEAPISRPPPSRLRYTETGGGDAGGAAASSGRMQDASFQQGDEQEESERSDPEEQGEEEDAEPPEEPEEDESALYVNPPRGGKGARGKQGGSRTTAITGRAKGKR
ncbi:hypothetical protein K437DRAFT_255446 [Tilletiaria anomala UBC 951]|uniref:CENP-C homolog n=1 Tax=Tilletiaria anomala (strain ATCC 24038 / CBS 436.72 / UBC 951) TaxID=1037660 RepID=A0A066W8P5_TILAU|nr:uncharacterized protein K437DRAFT_255446 [Tilletiaria anomala UBC 951]KDN48888.1 hypothetical protein K437DRAFT_255446 [Tilletiaria anomala UBC 951]